ncbi:MAG: hypothetical protein Q7R66_16545 [Undibacterium sp.]|uniref:hypothetical protein n=1 Tax=Undibacterium sp. TaxID=1914977 RepID=UPI002728D92F|nr:hypothetical protein [Undibacterium sp.]MDO8653790.1 hypothetical protein [Undibacterium sp.]
MKPMQLNILAASLVAAFAVSGANAGQISSSSVTLAREVVETNSQILRAPSKSYSFAGDIDARSNAQRLQVQLTLAAGEWSTARNAAVTITDGDGVAVVLAPTITVFLTADKKTMYANIDVPVSAANLIKKPIITFNAGSALATDNVGITKVRTPAGEVNTGDTCITPNTNIDVTFKHYTTFNSTALETGANLDSEDQRAGAVNTGRLINFTDNIKLDVKSTTGTISVNNAGLSTFLGTGIAFVNTSIVKLGTVQITKPGSGLDLDYTTVYATGATPSTVVAVAASTNGIIDAASYDVKLTALNGFAPNSTLRLASDAACTTFVGTGATIAAAGATTATISLTTKANIDAVAAAPHYVCYTVTGASIIPQTSNSGLATLLKAAPSTNDPVAPSTVDGVQEQRNICSGALNSVGGGVKIDVRNYATSKTAGGWMSVIRVINPSETTIAKVYGQLIHADGSYGGWGKLTDLAPRAVLNMTSAEVDAKLTGTPASNGTGYVAGAIPAAASATGDRLRITADNVGSLRVQNYLYNPDSKNFIEASSSQGVDFDAITDRSPDTSQTVVQDAQRGLAK